MDRILICAAFAVFFAASANAAEGAGQTDKGRTYPVTADIHVAVLEDRNSVFLIGDNRVLLAETNWERNAEALRALIAGVTSDPVALVVNSHWHGDHVGGNALFASEGALILAHENTRIRMSEQQIDPMTGNVQLEPQRPEALPMLTFSDKVAIHWGNETVELVHYPDAHTDADAVLYYRNANVIYVGGLMNYPTYAGVLSPEGFVAALDAVIARADAETKIIPWRGPVVGRAELQEWRNVLETVSANISKLIADGAGAEEIVAAKPSAAFDAKWGGGRPPETFVRNLHYVLTHAD